MTSEELQEIIQSLREVGADLTHVEAKRAERALPRRLWETLSAFANTSGGGVIILGVEGRITHADYRRLNPGLDSAEVTRHLADLVQRGLLNQHGTRRWTFYTLAEETESMSELELKSEEEAILNYIRAHGSINRSECASLLGVKPSRATYLLQTLRGRGVLRQ